MAKSKTEMNALVERYYSGEASLEEEAILNEHFSSEMNDPVDEIEQAQHLYFKSKKDEGPSDRLSSEIDKLFRADDEPNRQPLKLLLRIAATLTFVMVVGYFILQRTNHASTHAVVTGKGESLRMVLPDSSVVWLNESTTLTYGDAFNKESRTVQLQGEAYFEVQKNALIPFTVEMGTATAKVLGTTFNLRNNVEENAIELDVVEGKVDFGATKRIVVEKGMKGSYVSALKQLEVSVLNVNANSWKTHVLVFEGAKMQDVLIDLERYFHHPMELDSALLNCHFTGRFNNPVLKDVLQVLGYSLNIQSAIVNGKYLLKGKGCELK